MVYSESVAIWLQKKYGLPIPNPTKMQWFPGTYPSYIPGNWKGKKHKPGVTYELPSVINPWVQEELKKRPKGLN